MKYYSPHIIYLFINLHLLRWLQAIHLINLLDLGGKDQITFTLLPSCHCKNGTLKRRLATLFVNNAWSRTTNTKLKSPIARILYQSNENVFKLEIITLHHVCRIDKFLFILETVVVEVLFNRQCCNIRKCIIFNRVICSASR